jgi:hypothetical protein
MDRRPSRQTEAPETQTTADLKSTSTIDQVGDRIREAPDGFDLFDLGLRLGLAYGRRAGIVQGHDDENELWQAHMGVLVEVFDQPRHAELEAIRNDFAPRRCRFECGKCSACIRYQQARRNWARFRCADYPGGES